MIAYINKLKINCQLSTSKRREKRILILGGGFAGVECAQNLEKELKSDPDIEIILINEDNFMLFTPMLPQVISGMIETRHIVTPIRAICKKTTFYEGRVKGIEPHAKTVTLWGTSDKRGLYIHYDFLVIALGSETNFFGMSDVENNAYTLKTLGDAAILKNRIIDMLEQAENETDPILRKSMLCFVIAGAGFAGIETAGELVDLLHDARVEYYHSIKKDDIKVIVLDALPNVLPAFNQSLAKFAKEKMEAHGIEFKLQTAVKGFDGTTVTLKSLRDSNHVEQEETIMTKTLVWTAGVTPVNTIKRSMLKTERGKILVDEYLEVPGSPEIFAIGDCVHFVDPCTERGVPPTAQIAKAQGKIAAKNLIAIIKDHKKEKFVFKDKGQMAIIGKRTGIASIFGINISGFWAWVVWRIIYIAKIPSGEKKTRIFLDWVIDLFFKRDISRLKLTERKAEKEFKVLDEVDDLW